MKKYKYLSISIILILFVLFCVYQQIKTPSYDVIKINSANEIVLSNNNNPIKLLNGYETITRENIDTFNTIDEATKWGFIYLTEKYVNDILLDKNVEYSHKSNDDEIYLRNESYTDIMKKSGYLFKDKKPVNTEAYNKRLEQIKKAQYKIYNTKSNKYHELNCEYGHLARNYVLLAKSQLPKGASACKYCGIKNHNKQIKTKNAHCPNLIYEDAYIKVILNDYTTHLKPNRYGNTVTCNELIKLINSAKTSIDIAIYGYDKVPKVETAIKNAISRGVKIRLVHDVDANNNNIYEHTKYFADLIKNTSCDKSVSNSKYSNAIMHNKFYIFDKKIVMTGSANLSFTDMSDFNSNSVIIIKSEKVADIYTQEFNQMYNSKFHNLKSRVPNKENITLGNSNLSIYFSPTDKTIQNQLIPLINNSKKYIYIPAFIISNKNLSLALVNAKKRGVNVKIIVDATNAKNNYSQHKNLRMSKIPIKTENYAGKLHSKAIIIDDLYTVIGSMNFSNSGENKNDENVVIVKNSKLTKLYKEYFNYLWSKINDYWLTHDVSSESIHSIGSCADGIDNDYDGKTDLQDEGCKFYSSKSKRNRP